MNEYSLAKVQKFLLMNRNTTQQHLVGQNWDGS